MDHNIRTISLEIINDAYGIGMSYVKHQWIAKFFSRFFKPRIDNIIKHEASEEDLKKAMWSMKKKMDRAIKIIDTAEMLIEGEKLGSPQVPNIGELAKVRQFTKQDEKEALELLEKLNL